jgi:hypothetical protein
MIGHSNQNLCILPYTSLLPTYRATNRVARPANNRYLGEPLIPHPIKDPDKFPYGYCIQGLIKL